MPDYTQSEARGYLLTALSSVAGLAPDRHLWGNREAKWTGLERHYRLEDAGWEDLGWYRNAPGGRMRRAESIIVHLTHRMANSSSKTWERAAIDCDKVTRRLLNDTGIRAAGIRVTVEPPTVEESDSGDHLETDIPILYEYDFALTVEAA